MSSITTGRRRASSSSHQTRPAPRQRTRRDHRKLRRPIAYLAAGIVGTIPTFGAAKCAVKQKVVADCSRLLNDRASTPLLSRLCAMWNSLDSA